MPVIVFLFSTSDYSYYSYNGEVVWTKNKPGQGARTTKQVMQSVIMRGDY